MEIYSGLLLRTLSIEELVRTGQPDLQISWGKKDKWKGKLIQQLCFSTVSAYETCLSTHYLPGQNRGSRLKDTGSGDLHRWCSVFTMKLLYQPPEPRSSVSREFPSLRAEKSHSLLGQVQLCFFCLCKSKTTEGCPLDQKWKWSLKKKSYLLHYLSIHPLATVCRVRGMMGPIPAAHGREQVTPWTNHWNMTKILRSSANPPLHVGFLPHLNIWAQTH